jgi:hypothetical protein
MQKRKREKGKMNDGATETEHEKHMKTQKGRTNMK